jgi:hypothetical protein
VRARPSVLPQLRRTGHGEAWSGSSDTTIYDDAILDQMENQHQNNVSSSDMVGRSGSRGGFSSPRSGRAVSFAFVCV